MCVGREATTRLTVNVFPRIAEALNAEVHYGGRPSMYREWSTAKGGGLLTSMDTLSCRCCLPRKALNWKGMGAGGVSDTCAKVAHEEDPARDT